MMTATNTPLDVLTGLVADFVQGQCPESEFLLKLDRFEIYLENVADKLQGLEIPEKYPEAEVMSDYSMQGLQHFANAIAQLRELPERVEQELVEQALGEAAEGQELIAELLRITSQNIEQAKAERDFYAC